MSTLSQSLCFVMFIIHSELGLKCCSQLIFHLSLKLLLVINFKLAQCVVGDLSWGSAEHGLTCLIFWQNWYVSDFLNKLKALRTIQIKPLVSLGFY